MDERLKQRLVGAAVVVSLGVIFLPAILDGGRFTEFEKIRIEIPEQPESDFSSSIAPMVPPVVKVAEPEITIEKPLDPDDIDAQGKAPVIDEELAELIKPIEAADKIVARKGKDVRELVQQKNKDVKKDSKTTKKPEKKTTKVQKKEVIKPPTGPSSVKAWVVQVGSFSSRESAIKLRDDLRKKGFAAFVESFSRAGKPSHRVRIGPETTRARSDQILVSLKKKMQLEGIVVSYP